MAQVFKCLCTIGHGGSLLLLRKQTFALSHLGKCGTRFTSRRFLGSHPCLLHPRGSRSTNVAITEPVLPEMPSNIIPIGNADNIVSSWPEKKTDLRPGYADTSLHLAMKDMSASEILSVIMSRNESMDKVDLAIAVKQLFRLARSLDEEDLVKYKAFLASENGFQVLCALLALKGQYLEGDIAADMFLFLCYLGLDSDSPTMQVYLQLLKYYINDLTLAKLVRLGVSVSQMTPSLQTQTLNEGIRVACILRQHHISVLNSWELAQLLDLYGPNLDEDACIEIVEELAEWYSAIGWRLSTLILRALGKVPWYHEPLEEFCLSRIISNLGMLAYEDIVQVIKSCAMLEVYHQDHHHLFNLITTSILEKESSFSNKIHIATLLCEAHHFPANLVDNISEKLENSSSPFHQLSPMEILHIILLFSNCRKFETKGRNFVGELTAYFSYDVHQLSMFPADKLLDLAVSLCLLRCGHHIVSEILVNPNVQQFVSGTMNDLLLSQQVQNDEVDVLETGEIYNETLLQHPALKFLIAATGLDTVDSNTSEFVHDLKNKVHTACCCSTSAVKGAITLAVGCDAIRHNVQSKSGVFIDHIIRVQNICSGCEVRYIATLVMDPRNFYFNTGHLKSCPQYLTNLLKDDGYLILVINSLSWNEVPESERIEYLQNKLQMLTMEEDQCLVNLS